MDAADQPRPHTTHRTTMANLKAYLPVLQRSDPGVVDILGHAGHVVLYQFSTPEQAWAREQTVRGMSTLVTEAPVLCTV